MEKGKEKPFCQGYNTPCDPPNNTEANVKLTVHPVRDKQIRSGSFKGYALTGREFEEGWLISFSFTGSDPVTIWADGSFESPCFYSVSATQIGGTQAFEIDRERIELTSEEKDVVLGMTWNWEIWEPLTIAGTCMIDSLVRMLDLSRDVVLDWFRITGRDPSIQDDVFKTLEENGYVVHVAGPEGFGLFHDYRRLVFMFKKDAPHEGHVVLIYENDNRIFDSSGTFKKVGDILFTGTLGYNRGSVVRIEKR